MSAAPVQAVPVRHAVEFFTSEQQLAASVVAFLHPALAAGGVALAITIEANRSRFVEALSALDMDAAALESDGRLRFFDAAALLATVAPAPGHPVDEGQFRDIATAAVADAAIAAQGRPVAIFGELVALLWARGDVETAIRIEEIWNGLAGDDHFDLLCAYPASSLESAGLGAARRMCDRHDHVRVESTPLLSSRRSESSAHAVLLPTALAARAARRFVHEVVDDLGFAAVAEDAKLIVSELAANAVHHAASPFTVDVTRAGTVVRIAVTDGDGVAPTEQAYSSEALSGRGLNIVAALSDQWGTSVAGEGKVVWSDLRLPD